ncbi:MAG: UDP-galactopyranose mutase [Clostridia bacterium]|nr:UDP-galactopyranose mutase [Clostridia bacterium]
MGGDTVKYDYLIVGAGLYGAVFARQMTDAGKKCLVIEKRDHIAGNIYTEKQEGIDVHCYGAHIFHTSNRAVWDYVNRFAAFNHFVNSPIANYKGEIYNMPFNMNTFAKMFGIATPEEAKEVLEQQRAEIQGEPKNLEEQAISLVGRQIYEKLVKGYTEKQWGRDCSELPSFIIRRLPVRFTYDNNYFNDRYQGIPEEGYTALAEKLLEGIEVRTGVDFLKHRKEYEGLAGRILYTGPIDEYYDYSLGHLQYRSLRFENELLEEENHRGVAVVNYTDRETPYTRVIEHKHFNFGKQPKTVITREYPAEWQEGMEPYYPVNDEKNTLLYEKYAALAAQEEQVLFGGRLGLYKYFDMDKVVEAALQTAKTEIEK